MYIPFEFWFRDDWGKAVVNVNAEILRNVHNSQSVRNYLSANREGRQRKYMELMQTLEANGLETQAITDAEIVQRHLEWR
jgi:predicted transcriptional regulator